MSDDRHMPGDDIVDDQALDSWLRDSPTVEPPADFADRVVDAHLSSSTSTAPLRWWWAAAAVIALWVGSSQLHLPTSVDVVAQQRQQVALGDRGVLVVEKGAHVSADVGLLGDVVVEQTAGRVLHRVAPGGSYRVHTPAGDVEVTGTVFVVDVASTPTQESPMAQAQFSSSSLLRSAALTASGAAVALLAVHVLEGDVDVTPKNASSPTAVTAGEELAVDAEGRVHKQQPLTAHAAAFAQVVDERDALKAETKSLQAQLDARIALDVNGPQALVQENLQLQKRVQELEAQQEAEETYRAQKEGKPVEWPDDVSPAYQEAKLRDLFLTTMKDMNIPGDLKAIDCSEYPCIVWGEMKAEGDPDRVGIDATFRAFQKKVAEQMPEKTSWSTGVWGQTKDEDGVKTQTSMFGMAPYPHEEDEDRAKGVRKRTEHRKRAFIEGESD